MEEIVQALFEDGVLQRNGAIKLAMPMNAVKVPVTVQAILASRIDHLPAQEKELLQALAVIGKEFSLSIVKRPVRMPAAELDHMLGTLQLLEFIYEARCRRCRVYLQACIDTGSRLQRAADRAAQAPTRARRRTLESMFAEQLDDHLGELAHHYSRSDNVGKAANIWAVDNLT
jgi:hypothetical protein